MESLHWHSGLNLFLHSQKSPALQGLKDGASLAEPSFMCRTCGESRAASPELCRVAFATAGPKVNTGMGTSAQLRAHRSLGEMAGREHRAKRKIILNCVNSCFIQRSKCGWVRWYHHKKHIK